MAEQHIYAVTRVHINEMGLLSKQDLERLISSDSVSEALRFLYDKEWGAPTLSPEDVDALLAYELDRTWELIEELLEDMTPFDVYRIANDYHNLKAAIKLIYSDDNKDETGSYFVNHGTVDVEVLKKAAETHDFSALPEAMSVAGHEAYETLLHTRNGQSCDIILDRAALIAMDEAGKKCESELLKRYTVLTVDSANIKAAVRSCRMGKSRSFLEQIIAPAGTLDHKKLIEAAESGLDAIYYYLRDTAYEQAVEELKKSVTAFECWCDNALIALIKPQKSNYFTIEPLVAFILGRENEIKMVRLILSVKVNKLSSDVLSERLRDTYV